MKKMSGLLVHAAAVLLACLPLSALGQERADAATVETVDLPVTSVVLFTSGIGYFEHSGKVEGTVEVELPVGAQHMDDLLQSLVLQDFDGGTIRPVRYASRDPLGRILTSYSLDLSTDPTLAQILSQSRGESVLVTTSEAIRGRIVNVERVQLPEEKERTYLTLATAQGLQRILLGDVRRIQFESAELQEELDAALGALAQHRGDEESVVRLRFSGEGSRRVRIGYVREMPVWKTSYRLVLEKGGSALLQGWAIFDNPTSLDLEDVTVSFVAGQPISFVSSLFEPVYVERPRVEASQAPPIVPPAYEAEAAPAPAARAAAMMESILPPAAADRASGVTSMAEGRQTGATFEYRVDEPVSVGRFESVMIPIVQQEVSASLLSVYDRSVLPNHPLRGVRLKNDTGLHLAAGPVAVFTEGAFTGNSRIEDVVAGDSRLLTFAVDLSVGVQVSSSSEPEQVTIVAIRNGMVEARLSERLRTDYSFSSRDDQRRFLVVEHPKRENFELISPEGAVAETERVYRFAVEIAGGGGRDIRQDPELVPAVRCEAGAECRLRVATERVERTFTAVSNLSSDRILYFLENVELSEQDRETLAQILELKQQIARVERSLQANEAAVQAIHRDQERIRQNMASLDRNSSLYRRYMADLEEQENRLDAIEMDLEAQQKVREDLRAELDKLIGEL